jgi:uncharacterized membrane protein YcaP (DUF421 family)
MPSFVQAIIYFLSAMILLRITGKRTISQMTPSETVIMIGIGTVLVHPLKSEMPWVSVYHGVLIVLGVVIVSLLQIYLPKSKKWLMGEPILLIREGQVLNDNLKKARIPIDELKMMLRLNQINDISKVKSASFEVSGRLGIEVYPEHSYATKKDIEDLKQAIKLIGSQMNANPVFYTPPSDPRNNLFNQVEKVQEKDPLQ